MEIVIQIIAIGLGASLLLQIAVLTVLLIRGTVTKTAVTALRQKVAPAREPQRGTVTVAGQ